MEPRNPVEFDGFPIEMPVEFGVSDSQVMGADRHHLLFTQCCLAGTI